MNYFTRTYSLMKIAFHSHQIRRYRCLLYTSDAADE